MKFKYYVLNYDVNKKQSCMYNIFNNIKVNQWSLEAIEKYVKDPKNYEYKIYKNDEVIKGFDGLVKEIEGILKHELWSRCEYEVIVGDDFGHPSQKWDCFKQCEPNLRMIVREMLWQYKVNTKIQENMKQSDFYKNMTMQWSQNVTTKEDKDD